MSAALQKVPKAQATSGPPLPYLQQVSFNLAVCYSMQHLCTVTLLFDPPQGYGFLSISLLITLPMLHCSD
jgi:hypothetical protein